MTGIKGDGNGSVILSRGLVWVISLGLVVFGLLSGLFVPKIWAESSVVTAKHRQMVVSYIEEDKEKMGKMGVSWENHDREHRAEFILLMEKLGAIDRRIARLEPRGDG